MHISCRLVFCKRVNFNNSFAGLCAVVVWRCPVFVILKFHPKQRIKLHKLFHVGVRNTISLTCITVNYLYHFNSHIVHKVANVNNFTGRYIAVQRVDQVVKFIRYNSRRYFYYAILSLFKQGCAKIPR